MSQYKFIFKSSYKDVKILYYGSILRQKALEMFANSVANKMYLLSWFTSILYDTSISLSPNVRCGDDIVLLNDGITLRSIDIKYNRISKFKHMNKVTNDSSKEANYDTYNDNVVEYGFTIRQQSHKFWYNSVVLLSELSLTKSVVLTDRKSIRM